MAHVMKLSPGVIILSWWYHYDDVIMSEIASQITSLTIVYSTVLSGADQSKHQSSASLAFVWEIHRWPVNFPHKWPVTRKIFPFDDVIMLYEYGTCNWVHTGINHGVGCDRLSNTCSTSKITLCHRNNFRNTGALWIDWCIVHKNVI